LTTAPTAISSSAPLFTLLALALAAGGCRGTELAGELHAQKMTLEREVKGLRDVVARLDRGEPGLPAGDVAIAVEDSLLRQLVQAQLPLEADVERFHVRLDKAEVVFRGSPLVTLEGKVGLRDQSGIEGEVRVLGALEAIRLDPESGTLRATIAVDHIDIKTMAGLEQLVHGSALDELAQTLRGELSDRLPPITIPVKVQQRIDLPPLTTGPVRIEGASMPLEVEVSQVLAVGGTLWVAVHVRAGEFVRSTVAKAAMPAAKPTPAPSAAPKKAAHP
jgi:hypothetical protein